MPKDKTVDVVAMIEYLKTKRRRFMRLRKDIIHFSEMLWQMDNARPPHSCNNARHESLRPKFIYLLRFLNNDLKKTAYDSAKEVKADVRDCLRDLSENALSDQLVKLREHCKLVIESSGDHISSK